MTSKTGMTPAQKLANFGTKAEHYGDKTGPKATLTPEEKMALKHGIYTNPDQKNLSASGLTAS